MFFRSRNPLPTFLLSYHVRVTSKIQVNFRYRRYLNVHAFISSRLDYCNSLLLRHLRHSHSAATVSVACRRQTRYEKTKVRSDLRNHPRQASLAACSTTNRLQVGCSGLQVPAQSGSSLPDGDGTARVTHSRTAYASFISSRRCYRAEDRECSVGSSRFLERWTLTLEQFSNWLECYKPSFQCIYKTA